jgi:pimeloyl-ACP methyl ester carboxylesterase
MNNIWKWTKRIMAGLLILVLVLTALTYAAGAFAKRQLARENLPPGQLTNVGEYNMHIYCTGEGSPTVILEAGLNDFFVTWSKVQPEIAKQTRVCSYDRAGLGWSERNPDPRTSQSMVQELHTLLANTGIDGPYILVGHSFGGILMRLFAARFPYDVAGMVLVDSAHEQQIVRLPMLQEQSNQLVSQFHTFSIMSSFGLMALTPTAIPNRGFSDDVYQQYQAVLATTRYFDGAIAETESFYSPTDVLPLVGLGDLPLVVISHGIPDGALGELEEEWTRMQQELSDLSSKSTHIIANNSGHYIQLEEPQIVVESILKLVTAES